MVAKYHRHHLLESIQSAQISVPAVRELDSERDKVRVLATTRLVAIAAKQLTRPLASLPRAASRHDAPPRSAVVPNGLDDHDSTADDDYQFAMEMMALKGLRALGGG